MDSRVFMAEDDDNMEVNEPQNAPPKEEEEEEEEDEELEPASDKDGGEILDTDSEDDD
jgi:hypothetical protein